MKQTLILAIVLLILWSCNTLTNNSNDRIGTSESENKAIGRKFFEYDSIEYYHIDLDKSKIGELFDNQSRSEIDSLKMGIILGDIPNSMNDTAFIEKLKSIGYKRSIIDKSKFESIDKIFREKKVLYYESAACIYVYRDILIFKKAGKDIGTAKICFGCMDHQIHGTTADTESFGQGGDYKLLGKILIP